MTGRTAIFASQGGCIRVALATVQGSSPREAGTVMYVSTDAVSGTIGGGQLEYMAIDEARKLLARGKETAEMDVPLGPEIGQCCGGRVAIALTRMTDADITRALAEDATEQAARPSVYIFGAGHVGRALATLLASLPFRTILIDERAGELTQCNASIETRLTPLPEAEVRAALPGSAFVILTHDHSLDFLIASEALARSDAAYVGMIGSKTKRASFTSWCARNVSPPVNPKGLICPIGAGGSTDKRPEVIAAFAAAEIAASLTGKQAMQKDRWVADSGRGDR